jgi:hypothetical protein
MDQFLTISEYKTGKSFVVRGDTSQHKNKFLSMNGKFKSSLIGGPGWLFPIRNLGILTMYIAEAVEDDNNPLVMSTTVHANDNNTSNNKSNYPSYIQPPFNSLDLELGKDQEKEHDDKCKAFLVVFAYLVSILVFIICIYHFWIEFNDNIKFYVNNAMSMGRKFNFDNFNFDERYKKLNDNIEFYVNNAMSMYRKFNFDDLKMKIVERYKKMH